MIGSPVAGAVESLEAVGVRFRLEGEKIKTKLPIPSPPQVREALKVELLICLDFPLDNEL